MYVCTVFMCVLCVCVCMRVLCENMYVQYVCVLRYRNMYVCMYVCTLCQDVYLWIELKMMKQHHLCVRYTLGDVLGQGGYSEVRMAVGNTALQQKVAVKIIDKKKLTPKDEVLLPCAQILISYLLRYL